MSEQLGEGYEMEWRKQVASLTKALDEQKERNALMKSNMVIAQEEWEDNLAASRAREEKLREALTAIKNRKTDYPSYTAWEALTLPTDDSALQQRLAQERERCAKVCEEANNIGTDRLLCAAAIRSMK